MKKFIAFVPMQTGANLLSNIYQSDGNPRLQTDFPIHFPITAMVNGYAAAGEEIEIIALVEENNPDCANNLELLREEVESVAARKGFMCRIRPIALSRKETVEEHLHTFVHLIEGVEDGDELFACITFGTKPTPIVEMMALNFCYKTKRNVSIGCIAYGKVNRANNTAVSYYIYDVTALFFMNEIVNTLAEGGEQHPEAAIRRILGL